MTISEEKRRQNDELVRTNIAEYGCHVISVFDPEGKEPTFSYSVGIQEDCDAPEAIVIGVRPELGHSMINEYKDQVRRNGRFTRGVLYPGFLDGFSIYVEPARSNRLGKYTLGCDRYYRGKSYEVVQLIYPTTSGVWPWQTSATEWFKTNQPMLGRVRPNRP